eukprot:m.186669 g.186669  ORF g.186669 m.186669 type:complete len:160 (+) comp16855_c0_seq1:1480-1959(+)
MSEKVRSSRQEQIKQRLARFREEKAAQPPTQPSSSDAAHPTASQAPTTTHPPTAQPTKTKTATSQHATTTTDLQWWTQLPLWVKVVTWVTAAGLAEYLGEMRAFLVIAGFVVIYAYTRETTRRPGDKSAYSVFNRNCEKIDGTFDYNEFEKSLRRGGPV